MKLEMTSIGSVVLTLFGCWAGWAVPGLGEGGMAGRGCGPALIKCRGERGRGAWPGQES